MENKSIRTGLMAQDLKRLFPQFVLGEETEKSYLSINYAEFATMVAVKGVQELDVKIKSNTEIIRELTNRVQSLESEIQRLKN
ncbi:hypothetical protein [Marinilabilia salmonicolor]|uniref:hypothetical protein n=1 Tax=Marinilabilia salmonicolor TaxID=989 RepID=UPI00046A495E|nr:hypothetical protein [Marinilabilia salmonicolor]